MLPKLSMVFDREVLERWLSPAFLPGGSSPSTKNVDETHLPNEADSLEGIRADDSVETSSSKDATEVPSPDSDITLLGAASDSNGSSPSSFDNKAIVCCHGRLDPGAANRMKRVSLVSRLRYCFADHVIERIGIGGVCPYREAEWYKARARDDFRSSLFVLRGRIGTGYDESCRS